MVPWVDLRCVIVHFLIILTYSFICHIMYSYLILFGVHVFHLYFVDNVFFKKNLTFICLQVLNGTFERNVRLMQIYTFV